MVLTRFNPALNFYLGLDSPLLKPKLSHFLMRFLNKIKDIDLCYQERMFLQRPYTDFLS